MARGFFNAEILGVKETDEAFRKLGRTHTRAILQRLLKKAAKPAQRVASALAPRDDEPGDHMADHIEVGRLSKSQVRKRKRKGQGPRFAEVFIGPASRFRHAHLVAFGTGPRIDPRTGKGSGSMPPNPFMDRAFRLTRNLASKAIREGLWDEIVKTARRLRNRALKGHRVRLG